jgi:hypothetical protein
VADKRPGQTGRVNAHGNERLPNKDSLIGWSACARYGAPASDQLVDADEMARVNGHVLLPRSEVSHPAGRARKTTAAQAQECQSVTEEVLAKLLATRASENLRDLLNRATLMVGFASGGRRRSGITGCAESD